MPAVRKEVIAILTSDWHLSLNAPIWRSTEPDWFAAMKRPLDELKKLQEKNECPILVAGDIFDKWNSPPELINWTIDNIPERVFAIPGQHDLPLHNYEDIKKSAYLTLVKAKKVIHLDSVEQLIQDRNIIVTGFSFGDTLKEGGSKNKITFPEVPKIAIAHEYKWIAGHNYTGAPKESQIGKRIAGVDKNNKWLGYDVIVYGDNHKGFLHSIEDTQIFNCGSLMRRNLDQEDYKPQVGLLYSDGSVKPHYLDVSEDKHLDISRKTLGEDSLNMRDFIKELEKLGDTDLNFNDAMNNYLKKNKIKMPIANIILKAMGQ